MITAHRKADRMQGTFARLILKSLQLEPGLGAADHCRANPARAINRVPGCA